MSFLLFAVMQNEVHVLKCILKKNYCEILAHIKIFGKKVGSLNCGHIPVSPRVPPNADIFRYWKENKIFSAHLKILIFSWRKTTKCNP